MKLAFGSDHAGYELKSKLSSYAAELGHSVSLFGADSAEPYDYPLVADGVVAELLEGRVDFAVLICGTGIGVSIRANRYERIRAAVCCSPDTALLARQHNHANVLCLGARTTSEETAQDILATFLNTSENGEERHVRRVRELDGNS